MPNRTYNESTITNVQTLFNWLVLLKDNEGFVHLTSSQLRHICSFEKSNGTVREYINILVRYKKAVLVKTSRSPRGGNSIKLLTFIFDARKHLSAKNSSDRPIIVKGRSKKTTLCEMLSFIKSCKLDSSSRHIVDIALLVKSLWLSERTVATYMRELAESGDIVFNKDRVYKTYCVKVVE